MIIEIDLIDTIRAAWTHGVKEMSWTKEKFAVLQKEALANGLPLQDGMEWQLVTHRIHALHQD